MQTERKTFIRFITEIVKIRKITFGLICTLVGYIVDIFQFANYLINYFSYFKYLPFILILFGIILVIWGFYEYYKYLNKLFEELKNKIVQDLTTPDEAEVFFRELRKIIKKEIATLGLYKLSDKIKFFRFSRNEKEEPMAILNINGIKEEHCGAQIECRQKDNVTVGKDTFTTPSHIGYLGIDHIDKKQNIAYCLMVENENKCWKDIIVGIRNNLNRTLPDRVDFYPKGFDSLHCFSLSELKEFYKLLNKFSKF